jgi:hypothetical protein
MLAVLADLSTLRTFVRALIDIIQYIQVGISNRASKIKQQQADAVKASQTGTSEMGAKNSGGHGIAAQSASQTRLSSSVFASNNVISLSSNDPFADENAELMVTWPTNKDRKVTGLYYSFFNDTASCDRWTAEVASAHISILWVMLLRFQCGLRGLKASKLVGKDIYQVINSVAETNPDIVASFEQVLNYMHTY